MQRLAALVPCPRLHLIRFGVLVPNAKLLAMVVPQEPEKDAFRLRCKRSTDLSCLQ